MITCAAPSRADDLRDHTVFERADILFGRIGVSGSCEKLADAAHYEKVEFAGHRVFVLLCWDQRRSWVKILDCDTNGTLLGIGTLSDKAIDSVTAISRVEIQNDSSLKIDLHVNPQRDISRTVDFIAVGQTIASAAPAGPSR